MKSVPGPTSKNRLDSDRRLYAFFHPRMPAEPLIFVEVALTDHLADNVQALLGRTRPGFRQPQGGYGDLLFHFQYPGRPARVSFGNFLLKRVIDDLQRDFPRLAHFATLSPMPGLAAWVRARTRRCWAGRHRTVAGRTVDRRLGG